MDVQLRYSFHEIAAKSLVSGKLEVVALIDEAARRLAVARSLASGARLVVLRPGVAADAYINGVSKLLLEPTVRSDDYLEFL